MKHNILLVEDDQAIQEIVSSYLIKSGFQVLTASDGLEAMVIVKNQSVDLVILDILIPYLDGFTVCKYIREHSFVPIIMLTAKSAETAKLKGYELGADDYMVKPFSPKVLVAKVRALLKRSKGTDSAGVIESGNISLNQAAQTVTVNGLHIDFTHKEYKLLEILMTNPCRVFSREELLSKIWGYDYTGNTRTVDTHIKRVRAKLGSEARHIVTLIKSGYKFEVR